MAACTGLVRQRYQEYGLPSGLCVLITSADCHCQLDDALKAAQRYLRAGCKGGQVYFSVFDSASLNNCTFDSGTQTVSFTGSQKGGLCATAARYTYTASSAGFLEQFTTASVTASTCALHRGRIMCNGYEETYTPTRCSTF